MSRPNLLIGEATNLLARYRPNVLQQLRESEPELEEAGLLTAGQTLGRDTPVLLAKLAKVMAQSLAEMVAECDSRMPESRTRLKRMRTWQSVGEAMAVVGSASVVGLVVGEKYVASIVTGAVALIGSLTTVVTNYLGRTHDAESSLGRLYAELSVLRTEARMRASELQTRVEHYDDSDEWNKSVCDYLVREGNDLCRRISGILDKLPE